MIFITRKLQNMFTCLKIRSFNLKILKMMLIVHVHVHVKEGCEEAFRAASLENARNSVQEPGVARFDVCQQNDDPTRFVLVEVYRDEAAPAAHKETAHYQTWRDTVADMMVKPRQAVKFSNCFPDDDGW
jgi:quinol monooxygenase YgiN